MKTRFQISMKRSPSCVRASRAGRRGSAAPWSKKISEQGPQGPVSPIGQKLSDGRDADDPALGQAGDLLPQAERLVVVGIDGDEQLVLRQAVFAGDQLPGKLDGVFLEVVAEGEIAEHLEEGVVPGGIADIVQVVVLAAGADAFLAVVARL